MNTITTSKKEFKEIFNIRRQLDKIFRLLINREIQEIPTKNNLLDLAKLRIQGGPRDLSSKLDFYLYSE